jgi:hypothetical protein
MMPTVIRRNVDGSGTVAAALPGAERSVPKLLAHVV